MAMRPIVVSVVISLVIFASAAAQMPDPYPIMPAYWEYTNNSDTTTPFSVICRPVHSFYIPIGPAGIGGGFTVNGYHFELELNAGQTLSADNNWSGAPWTVVIYGYSDSHGYYWTLTCDDPYAFGTYTTSSCVDQDDNPVTPPDGTWQRVNAVPPTTLGDITSTTTAVAAGNTDQSRTEIGIGEAVTCVVDYTTWVDIDYDPNTQTYKSDTLATLTWSVDNVHASLRSNGFITLLTAPLLTVNDGNQAVTVTFTAIDNDASETMVRTETFQVIRPSDIQVDSLVNSWTSDAGTPEYAGAQTIYNLTVLPTTVSFYNVAIREHVMADTFADWPNGDSHTRTTFISTPPIFPQNDNTGISDTMGDCWDISKFNASTLGGGYTGYSYTTGGSSNWWYEHADYNGGYQEFVYRTDITTFSATATTVTTNQNYCGVLGSWQGPFQNNLLAQ